MLWNLLIYGSIRVLLFEAQNKEKQQTTDEIDIFSPLLLTPVSSLNEIHLTVVTAFQFLPPLTLNFRQAVYCRC